MRPKFRVRFNLGRGVNYMKWQVKNIKTGEVMHFGPDDVFITMRMCTLKNNPETAKKIHEGANKRVCAWIECESVEIDFRKLTKLDGYREVAYNPRKHPHWSRKVLSIVEDENIDNESFFMLQTMGRRIFEQ